MKIIDWFFHIWKLNAALKQSADDTKLCSDTAKLDN